MRAMTHQRRIGRKQQRGAQRQEYLRADEQGKRGRQRHENEAGKQEQSPQLHRPHFAEPRIEPANGRGAHQHADGAEDHEEEPDLVCRDGEPVVQVEREYGWQRVECQHG